MWQTKYASAVPKNLGVDVQCSEDFPLWASLVCEYTCSVLQLIFVKLNYTQYLYTCMKINPWSYFRSKNGFLRSFSNKMFQTCLNRPCWTRPKSFQQTKGPGISHKIHFSVHLVTGRGLPVHHERFSG